MTILTELYDAALKAGPDSLLAKAYAELKWAHHRITLLEDRVNRAKAMLPKGKRWELDLQESATDRRREFDHEQWAAARERHENALDRNASKRSRTRAD